MKVQDILGLLGGLALFLYGMSMMSGGLEDAAGEKLEYVLERLTNHKIKAIVVGTILTCIMQSSSAMTVMLIGFINAGLMSLTRAVWVVMGANIGTTITGQMIAFDIGMFAPLLAIIGVIFIVFFSNHKVNISGEIIAGMGMLFMGLDIMSESMLPLQSSEIFLSFMTTVSHPLLGIVVGAIFTAIIQSSSASIGILQKLAVQGLLSFPQAVYFLLGFDIGTCMTAFIASSSGCRNAKRLALFHLFFNLIGAGLFVIICQFTPIISIVAGWSPNQPMRQIANMHTFFNLITVFILMMIDHFVVQFIYWIYPLQNQEMRKQL